MTLDDDAVEHEYHPSDGGCGALSLNHDGDDIHTARTPADFEGESYAGADADTAGQSGKNFLVKDELGRCRRFSLQRHRGRNVSSVT